MTTLARKRLKGAAPRPRRWLHDPPRAAVIEPVRDRPVYLHGPFRSAAITGDASAGCAPAPAHRPGQRDLSVGRPHRAQGCTRQHADHRTRHGQLDDCRTRHRAFRTHRRRAILFCPIHQGQSADGVPRVRASTRSRRCSAALASMCALTGAVMSRNRVMRNSCRLSPSPRVEK